MRDCNRFAASHSEPGWEVAGKGRRLSSFPDRMPRPDAGMLNPKV